MGSYRHAKVQELIDFCREYLAPYKIPEVFEFRPSLPRVALTG